MRIFILNYCIILCMLLALGGAWWVIQLLNDANDERWAWIAIIIFVGMPVLAALFILFENLRDQIRDQERNKLKSDFR